MLIVLDLSKQFFFFFLQFEYSIGGLVLLISAGYFVFICVSSFHLNYYCFM